MHDDATPPSTRPVESEEFCGRPGHYAAGANGGLIVTTPEGKDFDASQPDHRTKRLPRPK